MKHREEISLLKALISKAVAWFSYFCEMLRMKNLCQLVEFNERKTATLVKGRPLKYTSELYSEEHRWKFTTEKAGFQIVKDPMDKAKLVLCINGQPIGVWFKGQLEKIREITKSPKQKSRYL